MPAQPIDIYFWPTPNCGKVRGIDVGTDLRTEGLTAEQQRIVFGKRDDVDGPS